MASDDPYQFTVILVGDSLVGKTAFLWRFTEATFTTAMSTTIGMDLRLHDMEVDGKAVKLEIWDTAGQEKFHTITRSYYSRAQGIIVMFATTRYDSFEHIPHWLEEIHRKEEACIIVVGNKSDCVDQREVSYEAAQQLSQQLGVTILEASARNDWNVTKTFEMLASAMVEVRDGIGAEPVDDDVVDPAASQPRRPTRKCRC